MPDYPAAALRAAADAIERELLSGKDYSMAQDSDEALARAALDAAAPILAEAGLRMIPASELEAKLWEIWEYTREMATRIGNTYGVDQVGKCIEMVRRWPDDDWRTYPIRPPVDRDA